MCLPSANLLGTLVFFFTVRFITSNARRCVLNRRESCVLNRRESCVLNRRESCVLNRREMMRLVSTDT